MRAVKGGLEEDRSKSKSNVCHCCVNDAESSRWNLGQHQGTKTIVNIFSPRARHRSARISPLIPVFAKSNVILLIEPHRMSSLGKAKSFATVSDINPPGKGRNRLRRKFLSLFSDSSHFSFVRDKKERAKDGICKMTSGGMHLRPGLFSWLLGLKARYPLYALRFIRLYTYFTFRCACYSPWHFRFLLRQCRKKYPATYPRYTHLVHVLRKPSFPFFPPNDDKYPLPLN